MIECLQIEIEIEIEIEVQGLDSNHIDPDCTYKMTECLNFPTFNFRAAQALAPRAAKRCFHTIGEFEFRGDLGSIL